MFFKHAIKHQQNLHRSAPQHSKTTISPRRGRRAATSEDVASRRPRTSRRDVCGRRAASFADVAPRRPRKILKIMKSARSGGSDQAEKNIPQKAGGSPRRKSHSSKHRVDKATFLFCSVAFDNVEVRSNTEILRKKWFCETKTNTQQSKQKQNGRLLRAGRRGDCS